ncbi:hypothetical protein RE428_46680 [Marinobacter nanhaiticus D15-8W]|uniref:Uncharacterized protein n=1 Tax=Marinobacter nanhaiticus D15-8W TaxID=626887 RepID=N6WV80_9GAMM|nr:hypothetical protein [Marinobacter nanhaiticus]ENO15501.1 hypothetical protein J057_09121 [Marinobacter nanhaiticus D15-8W]BES73650.1 hypothetical protein RE428_46680 [Marinobacter nanhaiticus D15-8W]
MFEWISQHSSTLQVFTSLGTLFIWLFYAQLLYSNYKRDTRPRVLINKGVGGDDLDSPCLICNMSKEPIFLQCLVVELETSEGVFYAPATDSDEGLDKEENRSSLGDRTRQGPLHGGSCIEVKNFRQLINRAAAAGNLSVGSGLPQDRDVEFLTLRLTVISIYGPEDHPFGAARSFSLDWTNEDRDELKIQPMSLDTERLTSKKDKEQVSKWLWEYI